LAQAPGDDAETIALLTSGATEAVGMAGMVGADTSGLQRWRPS
jgi:hypothetical protein